MGAELIGKSNMWVPRTNRAAQRRRINQIREKFSHAQALFDEYAATRPWIPPAPRDVIPATPSLPPTVVSEETTAAPVSAIAALPEPPAVPPATRHAHRAYGWTGLGAIVLTASLGSLGVAHFKLSNGAPIEKASFEGTAFEGTIQPATTFTVAAPAALVVKQVLVSVGDRVTVGQPLLVTDDRDASAAREAAALDVRSADARVQDLQRRLALVNRVPAEDIARAAAKVSTAERDIAQVPTRQWRDSPERAQAAYDQAKSRADRAQRLFAQGLIARQDMEDAEIAIRVAQDDLNNARRAASAGSTLQSAQTEQTEAQLQLARAERAQQRVALEGEIQAATMLREQAAYRLKAADQRVRAATVTATSAGVVVDLPVHAGDQVFGGAPLVRVAVLDRMVAEVEIAPSLVNALRPGAAAIIRLPGIPPTEAAGTIASVNPIPARNGNHVVAVRFDNTAGRLLAGQAAEVRFRLP